MKKLLILVVLLVMIGSASAATRWFNHFDASGTNDLWSNNGNWNNLEPPFPSGLDGVMFYPNNGAGGLCQP